MEKLDRILKRTSGRTLLAMGIASGIGVVVAMETAGGYGPYIAGAIITVATPLIFYAVAVKADCINPSGQNGNNGSPRTYSDYRR